MRRVASAICSGSRAKQITQMALAAGTEGASRRGANAGFVDEF